LNHAPPTRAHPPANPSTEAKATPEVKPPTLRNRQQKTPAYQTINPNHKVPLLVVDGQALTESTAIQLWIARNFPQANLIPTDPWQQLKAISLHSWCSSGIHPYLSRLTSPPRVCDVAGTEDSVRRLASEPLFENYKLADDMLAGREFFFDHFTSCDAHFFWCFRRGQQFDLDLSGFKNCVAHFERMQTRASVQKLLEFEKSVLAEFAKAA
jgi:glutathione S-transferase